jgi:hypothetical protein
MSSSVSISIYLLLTSVPSDSTQMPLPTNISTVWKPLSVVWPSTPDLGLVSEHARFALEQIC